MKGKKLFLWIVLGVMGFFNAESTAQSGKKNAEKFGFFLEGNRRFARIPFELHANLIVVPIKINDSDTLRFILDTGVSTTIVTDPAALKKQNLHFTRQVKLTGAGEGNALTASVAIGNTIRMGVMRANLQNIVVLNEDALKLSEYVGVPIHGIFGYDIFNNFVVTIDFGEKIIYLFRQDSYTYRKWHGDKYPISIEETKPYAAILAVVENGRERPIKVLIDTGAGHALLLDKTSTDAIKLPQKQLKAQLGRGLNGVINGSLGRIEKIKFGRHELRDVLTSFPDSLSFGMKVSPLNERQGNIGCELLRRFRITFNYPERYIVLKPIRRSLKETFEHDMSGVELRARGLNLREYVIDHVAEDSPASRAGLQQGDVIVYINNQRADGLSISEIHKMLQRKEGDEILLLLRREGDVFFAKFQLKRMI